MSFYCDNCHFKNTEVQAAGQIQEKGIKYVLKLQKPDDMQRQIVKSDTAVCRLEDLDLEIPAGRGRLTNVEGILSEIKKDLEQDQDNRKEANPDLYAKIGTIIAKLVEMLGGSFPYSISVDDPAGNSWIEPSTHDEAKKYTRAEYNRTAEQNAALGLQATSAAETSDLPANSNDTSGAVDGSLDDVDILEGENYSLPCHCPGCSQAAVINMQMVNVPYFKQVIISAVVCDHCGYRTNEVKTGGEIPRLGKKIWLEVDKSEDLSRDILKSETCCLKLPECDIEVQPGTMGGRFTTVEGLLTQVRNDLRSSIFDIDDDDDAGGDSMPNAQKLAWQNFFSQLDKAIHGEMRYTILLEDPLANSYVQSLTAPEPDPQIRTEDYERTAEEEDDLGINDMRTKQNADGEYVKE